MDATHHRRTGRARVAACLAAVLAASCLAFGTASCASEPGSCKAKRNFNEAIAELARVDIEEQGTAGLRGAVANVGRAADDLADAADKKDTDAYDQLKSDIDGLLEVLGPATDNDADLQAGPQLTDESVTTLLQDARAFGDASGVSC